MDFAFFSRVLTELNVSWNSIGPAGAAALADALRGNGVLTTLALPHNNIGAEGAAAIAEALHGNAVLKYINSRTTVWREIFSQQETLSG